MSRAGLKVGITGGIACGKSEVGRILRRRGVPVLDADDVARAALRPGRPAYRSVVRRFGLSILGRGGAIDRAALGRRAFSDAAALADLNARTHPEVFRALRRWLREATRRGSPAAAIVPLLFETGAERYFDVVMCVGSPRRTAVARLRARGLTVREAARRIRAQMPLREKRKRADVCIRNRGTLADLARTTRRAWMECVEKKEGAGSS